MATISIFFPKSEYFFQISEKGQKRKLDKLDKR